MTQQGFADPCEYDQVQPLLCQGSGQEIYKISRGNAASMKYGERVMEGSVEIQIWRDLEHGWALVFADLSIRTVSVSLG